MIELSQLERMFDNIRAKTSWKIDGPMLWGYFFFDPDESKLRSASEVLIGEGYRLVNIQLTDTGETNRLHMERVEIHSPQSLDQLNQHLYRVASDFSLERYDGMDVGPAPN